MVFDGKDNHEEDGPQKPHKGGFGFQNSFYADLDHSKHKKKLSECG